MDSYIIIHHTDEIFQMALFFNTTLRDQQIKDKRLASKLFIPLLEELLMRNSMTISHLSFIGVNQGPGLFSTLRSILSTINGLHFATAIPLIGIDGLNATSFEFYTSLYPYTVILLNAYNNEVHYSISHKEMVISTGYENIHVFLDNLLNNYPAKEFYFVGSGATIYQEVIKDKCGSAAIIPDIIPQLCSISTIASLALQKFHTSSKKSEAKNEYLFPLHLKKHPAEMK